MYLWYFDNSIQYFDRKKNEYKYDEFKKNKLKIVFLNDHCYWLKISLYSIFLKIIKKNIAVWMKYTQNIYQFFNEF